MVDLRTRPNEKCVIGMPACNYWFSSSNACFIAYGFKTSSMEKDILIRLLMDKGIEPVEASQPDSAQLAFCTKICSKIITSKFCIVLLNEDEITEKGINIFKPNSNVNIEYGQMIGFNKYIISFQDESFTLPFNVSGLDTIKYNKTNFKDKAEKAIEKALSETSQINAVEQQFEITLRNFFLSKDTLYATLSTLDEKTIYELGMPCGFNLLITFNGLAYRFFGLFTNLNIDKIKWRIDKLCQIITARGVTSIGARLHLGMMDATQASAIKHLIDNLKIMVLVNDEESKASLEGWYNNSYPLEVYTMADLIATTGEI